MRKFGIVITTLICVGLSALAAQAAAVHYTFNETSSGTWEVLVQVTPAAGDTMGLSAYAIWVDSPGVSYVSNKLDTLNGSYAAIGFLTPVSGYVGALFNAGNFQTTGSPIYDVGINPVYILPPPGPPPVPVDLGVPALLGTLTTPAGLTLTSQLYPGPAGTGLFNGAGDGYQTSPPTPTWEVNPIPEPVTLTLLGLGGLAMLIRRRR